MIRKRYGIGCTALTLTATLAAGPLAAQPMGEEWEYRGNMEMQGMNMLMPPTVRCELPGQDKTPPLDSNCKVSDVQVKGDTTSFKVVCGPPSPKRGNGRTKRLQSDYMDISYTLDSEDGEMVYTMSGTRHGACTP